MIDPEEIRELKHSVKMHLLIMAGPSQQLCSFLIRTIDFIEDTDPERRKNEILSLSFNIVEAIGVFVHNSIDARSKKDDMPQQVKDRGDEIIIVLGKSRKIPDKIVAKNALLKTVAEALDALGLFTKSRYPTLSDSQGNPLNNFEPKPS